MTRLKSAGFGILPWLVVGAIGYFFYKALSSNWSKLQAEMPSLAPNGWALLGVISFAAAVLVSGALWGKMLGLLSGTDIKKSDAVRIHSASWLLKYVPGQVASYIYKLAWGHRRGISKKTVSTSFIYENVLMVFAGLMLSIPILWLFGDKLGRGAAVLLPLLVVIPMLVVMIPRVFYWLLNSVFKKLGRELFKKSDFLGSKELLKYQLGYLLPRLLNGVGFVFIVMSVYPVEPSQYVGLAAIYILGSIIGMLAIFVPSGIGVREAAVVALASVYFPLEQAIVLALLARLYATIADIGVAIVYLVLNKGKIKQLDSHEVKLDEDGE